MQPKDIEAARDEALRFVERAEELLNEKGKLRALQVGCGCKESGAVRRASLDLTRALTKMRQS